jgi:thiol:disulfide interchange protein
VKVNLFLLTTVILLIAHPVAAQIDPLGLAPLGGGAKDVVNVQAVFSAQANGQPARLFVTATIIPPWHIYSITQPDGGPIATKIDVQPPPGVRVGRFRAHTPPEQTKQPAAYGNLPIELHNGTVTWFAPLEFDAGVDPAGLQISGTVTVQPCDADSCLPPTAIPFAAALGEAPVVVDEAPATRPFHWGSFFVQLGFAFLGGLILNLMPCVLPVISLKLLAFLQQSGESRGRVFMLNVWYAIGMLAVFLALAALAAAAGLAWGEQFTLPWFKVAMTALVFVMALSFLGVWEIPIPGFVGMGKANELQAREGPSGAFFKGVFTTILATPCSGPFLGPVFGYLLGKPPLVVYGIFAAVGLGMASPYLLIGAFPALIRYLPKPGAWMDTFKQIMAFLLLGTVVYLFNTLRPAYFVPTLMLLIGLWFACWLIGRTPLTASPAKRLAAWLGGATVAAAVGWAAFAIFFSEPLIPWQPFSPTALQQARAEGKTVMVDFTANWCPNCKVNSKVAIERPAVLKLVRENGVVPMLADWTDRSPVIKKALNELGYNSIPLLVVWPAEPEGAAPITLPDQLLERNVLDALKRAGPSKTR